MFQQVAQVVMGVERVAMVVIVTLVLARMIGGVGMRIRGMVTPGSGALGKRRREEGRQQDD